MNHYNESAPEAGEHVHSYEDDGYGYEIGYQGKILAVTGDTVRVQLYSWRDGRAADVISIDKADFETDWKCYTDRDTWRSTGEAEKAASVEWRRWNPPAVRPVAGTELG